MFAARITLLHLSVFRNELSKVGRRARKHSRTQVGEPRLHLGIAKAALTSLLSLSIISSGVFLGTPMPCHEVASPFVPEIFPLLMARRMLALFRPVAAAAAPRLYDMVLRTSR